MTTPTDLIERLEGASVGSQSLDAEICIAFQYGGPNSEGATNVRTDSDWEGDLLFEQGADECCAPIPPVTTSLDAALALAERVLPEGWGYRLTRTERGGHHAMTLHWSHPANRSVYAEGRSAPLAFCIATLRASEQSK